MCASGTICNNFDDFFETTEEKKIIKTLETDHTKAILVCDRKLKREDSYGAIKKIDLSSLNKLQVMTLNLRDFTP